jgi:N-acetyl-alpha-D-glucosaminyl L-malate synthase BshA
MLTAEQRPKIITTLHGTDTTLLGRDAGYGPAIRHALASSDAITTVSAYLKRETESLLPTHLPIHVIHNFFSPRPARRPREEVRRELGVEEQALIVHISNLRPVKRIDLLLETAARIRPRDSFKLLIIAGESFASFRPEARRLGLEDRLIIREKVTDVEDYLNAADLGLFTSESESFCLAILEAMCFACPSVATCVGGIPEVVEDQVTGRLVNAGDAEGLARAAESMIQNPEIRKMMGRAGKKRAEERFSAQCIVPQYESLYRKVAAGS